MHITKFLITFRDLQIKTCNYQLIIVDYDKKHKG